MTTKGQFSNHPNFDKNRPNCKTQTLRQQRQQLRQYFTRCFRASATALEKNPLWRVFKLENLPNPTIPRRNPQPFEGATGNKPSPLRYLECLLPIAIDCYRLLSEVSPVEHALPGLVPAVASAGHTLQAWLNRPSNAFVSRS